MEVYLHSVRGQLFPCISIFFVWEDRVFVGGLGGPQSISCVCGEMECYLFNIWWFGVPLYIHIQVLGIIVKLGVTLYSQLSMAM